MGTADEDALLARARRATAAGGSYLGLGYDAPAASGGGGDEEDERQGSGGGGGQRRNAFALLRPHSGGVAFRYAKAYPVPLVEHGYAAGPPELPSPAEAARPFPPSEEGGGGDWPALNASSAAPLVVRLSALICFDADFPRLVAQAGAPGSPRRADALLQPAQTWGGPRFRARHFRGDALRALENGVVLLRCAADGVSGAAGPAGQAWGTWAATGHSGVHTFSVPWPPGGAGGGGGGAATPFARGGGALLGAAAVAGAAAAVVALAVSAAPAAPAAAAGRAREEEERARSGDVAALA